MPNLPSISDTIAHSRHAIKELDGLLTLIKGAVLEKKREHGFAKTDQHLTHGLAWHFTYVEALRQYLSWFERLADDNRAGETEQLLFCLGFSEYCQQTIHGISMSQGEITRLADFGLENQIPRLLSQPDFASVLAWSTGDKFKSATAEHLRAHLGGVPLGDCALDETANLTRTEMAKFTETEILPHAQKWHLENTYIPDQIISKLGELGAFGLTIPEAYQGLGLSKEIMCVVTEELSRGWIGVGSLSTRSEIAAELIICGGTEAQKEKYLPQIADGTMNTTAVFTEPNTGSDLASLTTRAVLEGDEYVITGAKTWITHPVRADLMTMLVRTNPDDKGYGGLSMLLVEKPRGNDDNPFPIEGLTGTEIHVLGYRGMKEYELAFDGLRVPRTALLGTEEGLGFKQLMQTFEAARIQTAARAIGVAQSAFDLGKAYAQERRQFGRPILDFARVSNKLIHMALEIMIARQLTYFAARRKDAHERCDLEAGMAKLLAARVAWAAADNTVQIHGGNGFALEYAASRILCDSRILSIFEGAAEIQAQVIARRILEN